MQGQLTSPRGTAAPTPRITLQATDATAKRRKAINALMTGLIGGSATLGVSILGIILGYIIVKGAPALNLDFFIKKTFSNLQSKLVIGWESVSAFEESWVRHFCQDKLVRVMRRFVMKVVMSFCHTLFLCRSHTFPFQE